MDKIKFPKNFTLFKENNKETLIAFRANKSITKITREVFHGIIATPLSYVRPQSRTPTPSMALAPVSGGSHFAPPKMGSSDPIKVSKSEREGSLKRGVNLLVQSASPPPSIEGNIIIEGRPTKQARTFTPAKVDIPLPPVKERRLWMPLSVCPLPQIAAIWVLARSTRTPLLPL